MKMIEIKHILPSYDHNDSQNLELIPFMRRARDFHIYDIHAKRYLDLYRGDGKQLLGYSLPGAKESVANRLAHGFMNGLPHVLHQQLISALSKHFVDYKVLIFLDRFRLEAFVKSVLEKQDLTKLGVCLPFWSQPDPAEQMILSLPGLSSQGPFFLLMNKAGKNYSALLDKYQNFESIAQFEARLVPFFLLGIALKNLQALKTLNAFKPTSPSPAELRYQASLKRRLGLWQESDWAQLELNKNWQRQGPYLMHQLNSADYNQVFKKALSLGVLLNPSSSGLSILPGMMSDGEKALLLKVIGPDKEEIPDA